MAGIHQLPAREAVDLSHHLNAKSKARHPSPLKDIIKYMNYDGMISLAGGLPHPSLFPLQEATVTCLAPAAPISGAVPSERSSNELVRLSFGRGASADSLDLTPYLQYGTGAGSTELRDIARALTDRVHKPPYRYDVLLHPGNTNAWAKVVGLLCEDDDSILVEGFTYPSAQAFWIPLGMKAVPVCADDEGMSAERLSSLLAGWDTKNGRRPRLLYTVSIGSNPTGLSISAPRRKAIYDICVKYDIIIVEDDPYYFLQYPHYMPGATTSTPPLATTPDTFIASLTPSFLSLDVQGRVIRLDSFSKTLFPGLRLGYFIANPTFSERLLRATEVETQDPAGLSQALVVALMRSWKVDGYLTWMQSIREQYHTRRNWLVDAIGQHFTLVPAAESPLPAAQGWVACLPAGASASMFSKRVPIFSFVDPTAGMFLWAKFYFHNVPRFTEVAASDSNDPEQAFADELWASWAKELVLVTPGSYYHPWQGAEMVTTKARGAEAATAHFRLSFATPSKEQIEHGVERLAHVLAKYHVS